MAKSRFSQGKIHVPGDERGSVLIETAIIFPVLIIILLGMIEFGTAFTAKRRVQNVTSTTADLVAQYSTITAATLNDIASASIRLMAPFSPQGLSLTITSVAQDSKSNITVQWSCSWGNLPNLGSCSASGLAYTGLPTGLLSAGQSVIIGKTSYSYKPAIAFFLTKGLTFSAASYYRPRLTSSITMQ